MPSSIPPPLPIDLDDHFVTQITSEHLTKRKLPNGATEDVWQVGDVEPHLDDTMKEAIAFGMVLEPPLLTRIQAKKDESRARQLAKLTA